ncbi:MAG: transposase [Sulfurimonas sp.]|nr:transposase [Sulfurimonas sp.]
MVGLFDTEYHERKIKEYQPPLSKLNKVINWELFRGTIEETLYVEPKGAGGRPAFDKVMMFKILILQKYYNLSDEQTEFQINDRTSFKQFLGLKIGDRVPDEKTVWLFKENLSQAELSEKLFKLFTEQLMKKGIVAKEGSMIDASFVDVPRQRNKREDNADSKTKLITKYSVSSAAPHDSTEIENIIDETDNVLYADSVQKVQMM